ncbi:uncharacterized protein LOC144102179 [Amblyomma americanum]
MAENVGVACLYFVHFLSYSFLTDFAKFRTTPAPPPSTVTSTEPMKATALGRFPPIWRDRPATTISLGTTPLQEATTERSSLSTRWHSYNGALYEMRQDPTASQGRMSGETEGPLPNFEAVSMPRSTGFEQTQSKAKSRGNGIKVIESGGIGSGTTSSSTDGRRRGLLALPLPTKVYGPGPRSLLCLVAGGGVRRGPPLRECSHLVLGDQVLDLQHRVIKPAWRGNAHLLCLTMPYLASFTNPSSGLQLTLELSKQG